MFSPFVLYTKFYDTILYYTLKNLWHYPLSCGEIIKYENIFNIESTIIIV